MQRVISIQTSRGFGVGDEGESVTKRFCCSFVFAISFIALLGGFFLGRFSTYREFEIKKSHLETERHDFYERHSTHYVNINKLIDALHNLTDHNVDKKTPWKILTSCSTSSTTDTSSTTIKSTNMSFSKTASEDLFKLYGENIGDGTNFYIQTFVNEIINCVQNK